MRVLTIAVLSLLATLSASAGETQVDKTDKAKKVEVMLSGYEHQPTPSAWKEHLGADGYKILLDYAQNAEKPFYKRLRAISALANFKAPEVTQFLDGLAKNSKMETSMRRNAIMAFSLSDPENAGLSLVELSKDKDPFIREACVLTAFARPELAASWLEQRLQVEKEDFILSKLKKLKLKLKKIQSGEQK